MPGHSRILMLSTVANTDLNRQKYHLNFHKLSLLEHTFCSYYQLNVNLLEGKLRICIHIWLKLKFQNLEHIYMILFSDSYW